MLRISIRSLLARCGAAPLVVGLALALPAIDAVAQYSMSSYSRRAYPGQPAADEDDEDDDGGDEEFDPRMMFPGMHRGGRGGEMGAPGERPKTDLGKKIAQLQFNRSPQTVLAARTKLTADAREKIVNPEAAAKEEAEAAAAAGGDDEGGDMAMPPGGIPPEIAADMPPELRQMVMEQMQAAGAGGMPAEEGPEGAAAAEARGKAAEASKAKAAAAAKAARQAEHFQMLVVAGDWAAMGEFLKADAGEDAAAIYNHVLEDLQSNDEALVPDEVLAISEAAPSALQEKQITLLGGLLKATKHRGCEASAVAAQIKRGTPHFGGEDPAKRKAAASLLVAAGLSIDAVEYLAPVEQAREQQDADLLKLHAAYYRALLKTQQGAERQASAKKGWDLCREVLALPKATSVQRASALSAALAMLPEIPPEEGDAWLATLFRGDPDIGWKAIDSINGAAMTLKMRQAKPDARLKSLTMVRRLGKGIIAGAGDRAVAWRTGLDMLTMAILAEAEATKAAQSQPNYDEGRYGGYGERRFQPIPQEQLAAVLPDAEWLGAIDPGLAARFEVMVAATTAGSGETGAVLEMIRPIAASDPKRAMRLATALLGAWQSFARSTGGDDDMYAAMRYGGYPYSRYSGMGYGGYRSYDGSIPLTRARQHRNLEKLQQTLTGLAAMGVGPLPGKDIAAAFAVCHSDAEVFADDDIVRVFGPIDAMDGAARLKLAETMRQRLATIWRSPQVQQQAGTKRTDKELVAEVKRGYALAMRLVPPPEAAKDDDWAAVAASADLSFDLAEFLYGQKADLATYSGLRDAAFAGYRKAAALYAAALEAGRVQPSARVYVQWFSSSLGASDLGYLTRQDQPDVSQTQEVVAALNALPGAAARKHIGLFAQGAVSALREMNPELKARFARQALRVIGDHPEGATLRKTVAFYDDLDKEVELNVAVDGPSDVGHAQPFGVHISILSTRAVSREGGGFSKYLRNEQWHPQTGQPVNYKDDLEKQVRDKLGERFEVVAVQFHSPEVQPMAVPRQGWERFPLAYALIKARDASVDRVPPLQLDMDFADGQGTVILPVTSAVTLINAGEAAAPVRAAADLSVEQVLDDRSASREGIVKLDVRAKGHGLIPDLASLVDLGSAKGFRASKTDDHGLNIAELDTSGPEVVPVAERSWSIEFTPEAPGVASFAFPALKDAGAKGSLKRFADADIVDSPAVVAIGPIAGPGRTWVWGAGAAGVLLAVGAVAWYAARRRSRPAVERAPLFAVPAAVTPVNSIAILRRILAQNGTLLPAAEQSELSTAIDTLERRYFAPAAAAPGAADGELKVIVERWVRRANA